MAPLDDPPADLDLTGDQLAGYLSGLSSATGAPYIHARVVSFQNAGDQKEWVAIIQRPAGGKALLVWDCDPRPEVTADTRIKDALVGKQRAFFEYLQKQKKIRTEVWYNVDNSFSGQNMCLVHSLKTMRDWTAIGDKPFQGEDDPRAKGMILLKRL